MPDSVTGGITLNSSVLSRSFPRKSASGQRHDYRKLTYQSLFNVAEIIFHTTGYLKQTLLSGMDGSN